MSKNSSFRIVPQRLELKHRSSKFLLTTSLHLGVARSSQLQIASPLRHRLGIFVIELVLRVSQIFRHVDNNGAGATRRGNVKGLFDDARNIFSPLHHEGVPQESLSPILQQLMWLKGPAHTLSVGSALPRAPRGKTGTRRWLKQPTLPEAQAS